MNPVLNGTVYQTGNVYTNPGAPVHVVQVMSCSVAVERDETNGGLMPRRMIRLMSLPGSRLKHVLFSVVLLMLRRDSSVSIFVFLAFLVFFFARLHGLTSWLVARYCYTIEYRVPPVSSKTSILCTHNLIGAHPAWAR